MVGTDYTGMMPIRIKISNTHVYSFIWELLPMSIDTDEYLYFFRILFTYSWLILFIYHKIFKQNVLPMIFI